MQLLVQCAASLQANIESQLTHHEDCCLAIDSKCLVFPTEYAKCPMPNLGLESKCSLLQGGHHGNSGKK